MPVLGSSLTLFVVAAYLGLAFHASVHGSLRLLQDGVKAVSGGDLSHKIELPGSDELATIGTAVEGMNMRLSSLVAEIRTSAVRVGMSGQQVASSSESLAQRTEQQAASLRQTVETVQQLTDAVGKKVQVHYTEHRGIPTSCFGDTPYFVDQVKVVPE